MKLATTEHYMRKFNVLLETVEKECIKGRNNNLEAIANQQLHWSDKYLRRLFNRIADMPLEDYIRRRKLTEAYYSINNFETQKLTGTVNGIRQAKKKILKEFGNPPINLQKYIYDEVEERTLENRLSWKLENGAEKRVFVNEDRIILCSANIDRVYDLNNTYFIFGKKYFRIEGSYISHRLIKDSCLSGLLQTEVFYTIPTYKSSNMIVKDIYQVLKGERVTLKNPMNLILDIYFDESFDKRNLIYKVSLDGDNISYIETDKMIRIENDNLILDISDLQ